MSRLPVSRLALCALLPILLLASGCSVTPGGGVSLFPSGHYLLNTTKDLVESAPPAPQLPRELQKTVLPAYYVEPGDVLQVEPIRFDSPVRFPSDQTVLADGTIDLGQFGRLTVAGKTVEQIEGEVQSLVDQAEQDAGPINVRLIDVNGAVYYVLGEVNSPGALPLVGRETVLDGILAAGGLTERASTCNIIVSRPTPPDGCRVVLPVCYRQLVQLGDTTTNYQLMPGDRIYVASRTICEELMFWRARQDCPLCQGLQCPCPDPAMATYGSTYTLPGTFVETRVEALPPIVTE